MVWGESLPEFQPIDANLLQLMGETAKVLSKLLLQVICNNFDSALATHLFCQHALDLSKRAMSISSSTGSYPQRQTFEVPATDTWLIWQQLRQWAVPVWVDPSSQINPVNNPVHKVRLNVVLSSARIAERVQSLIQS